MKYTDWVPALNKRVVAELELDETVTVDAPEARLPETDIIGADWNGSL